ncbi:MAG: Rv3654c family TadE-like protein [Beutenbergiaceae bacterium]
MSWRKHVEPVSGRHRERGAGTVLVLAVMALALMVMVGAASLAQVAHARGAVQASADLAALAAATAVDRGAEHPCGIAEEVARSNGAQLATCRLVDGGDVQIETQAHIRVSGWSMTVRALARAGPVR